MAVSKKKTARKKSPKKVEFDKGDEIEIIGGANHQRISSPEAGDIGDEDEGLYEGIPKAVWPEIRQRYQDGVIPPVTLCKEYGIPVAALYAAVERASIKRKDTTASIRDAVVSAIEGDPEATIAGDVRVMNMSARISEKVLDGLEAVVETVRDPVALKIISEATTKSTENYRRVRGMDKPQDLDPDAIIVRHVDESGNHIN